MAFKKVLRWHPQPLVDLGTPSKAASEGPIRAILKRAIARVKAWFGPAGASSRAKKRCVSVALSRIVGVGAPCVPIHAVARWREASGARGIVRSDLVQNPVHLGLA
jgi:hypothetical protein